MHIASYGHLYASALLMSPTLCAKGDADAYLSSDALSNALSVHADVVRLAIFGHTHMDELHLVGTKGAEVPMKIIPSISPVEGNTPSVTVAKVDPASATLTDYTTYIASNTTGVNTTWTREYSFDEAYGETSFTAKALDDLIGRFRADTAGTSAESLAYQTHFYKGHTPIPLGPFWEGYVCSLDRATPDAFKSCACGGK
jgi:sphingomyelin phosphodiesterase acid-like 3